jgi:2-polyprenyl-3-methyl-5-hydroxy-6-metoxy-1,4-benzoquinol methylase
MSKYDFTLDMQTKNSNSTILNGIKPESSILEVGCAHGRMTKYLKETLKCNVDIIEIDEEAGKIASQWARNNWLGEVDGNIESSRAFAEAMSVTGEFYDYIVFADVLEHLIHPDQVLTKCKSALSMSGSVWISIPNVAYNGVIAGLINNNFTYRETGLLDNTHLRFFTYHSLKKFVEKAGFKVVTEHNLINSAKNSEFKTTYTEVPPMIASFLRTRPMGEVYQFVWELKAA